MVTVCVEPPPRPLATRSACAATGSAFSPQALFRSVEVHGVPRAWRGAPDGDPPAQTRARLSEEPHPRGPVAMLGRICSSPRAIRVAASGSPVRGEAGGHDLSDAIASAASVALMRTSEYASSVGSDLTCATQSGGRNTSFAEVKPWFPTAWSPCGCETRCRSTPRWPLGEDERLLAQIADGDHGAFEVLYRRYARPVLALAQRRLGDSGKAEEAVRSLRLGVAVGLDVPPRARGSIAWLYAVARNAIADRGRRRQELPEPPDVPSPDPGPCSGRSRWLRWRVHSALEKLPRTARLDRARVLEVSRRARWPSV